jgi:threonine/homoserine/homoserine lactone efflux protein
MSEAIISGILLGGVLALMVGPVFFMLIQTSIKKGFVPALMLSAGVIISDGAIALMAFWGSSSISELKSFDTIIGVVGGLLVMAFGVFNLFKEPTIKAEVLEFKYSTRSSLLEAIKGFSMNTLNPSVIIFWIGVAGTWSIQKRAYEHTLMFYGSVLLTVFLTDMAKAWGASLLKRNITGTFLLWMNRVSGIILLGFGLFMIVKFLKFP